MKHLNKLVALLLFFLATPVFAQGDFDVNLQLKNMHYWRGIRVTNSLVTATSVKYTNGGFKAMAWGGMSVDGSYKEVSSILSYTKGGFSVTILDIFNFSGTDGYHYFDFKNDQTNHILDATLAYDFTEHNFPLKMSWSTVLFGNDDGLDDACKNRYSTYARTGFPFTVKQVDVEPFIALGFALCPESENMLYSQNTDLGVVNVGMTVSKDVLLGTYTLPVAATWGFNPTMNEASIQLAVNVF